MSQLIVFVVLCLLAVCSSYPREYDDRDEQERSSYEELALRSLAARRRRAWGDCKPLNERCNIFPPCCRGGVCYFPNGILRGGGQCVSCIDRGLTCQRDSQCCEPLICHKELGRHLDGVCGPKRPLGGECHDDDQCESEYCDIGIYEDLVMTHGGTCAQPSNRRK